MPEDSQAPFLVLEGIILNQRAPPKLIGISLLKRALGVNNVRQFYTAFTKKDDNARIFCVRSGSIYYRIKPLIPRRLQVAVRRILARTQAKRVGSLWPIDPTSGKAPCGWSGWPEGKAFSLILTHDVETDKGQSKVKELARIEQEFGFRSSFNFVPERYNVSSELRHWLRDKGFEVGVHDLKHDGRLYSSKSIFVKSSSRINKHIRDWDARGFRSGSMYHNLEWLGLLDIDYDASTFDTDPFEPQSDGVGTIFPFYCKRTNGSAFVELPYTLAQDSTLFIFLQETNIRLWREKLDWIAQQGGMALGNVHPDYINFSDRKSGVMEYPIERYEDFLRYCLKTYAGQYWNALPYEVANFMLNHPMYAQLADNK